MSDQNPTESLASQHVRVSPEWITRSVMYQIYPRSFTSEGTLKAAMPHLDRLSELGIDVIYLCPVFLQDDDMREEFWSPRQRASGLGNPRNPYRIKDHYAIDPEYGTEQDLHEFVKHAHELGMRVILDLVYLHCGPTAPIIEKIPDSVKRDASGAVINAEWDFPAFNFENSELREYMWRNLEYWITEFKVDGYRCDVADGVPLDFWEQGRKRIEALNSDVIMLAEADRKEDQLFAFDLSYNFPLTNTLFEVMEGEKPASALREISESMEAERPQGMRYIRYTDNHDIAHETRDKRHDNNWGIAAADATLVLMFSLDGMPMLYNGQEIADTSQHTIYGNVPIEWQNGKTPEGRQRQDLCKRLCEIRHTLPALIEGRLLWLNNDQSEKVLSFLWNSPSGQALVLINLSDSDCKVIVELPDTYKPGADPLLVKDIESTDKADTFMCSPFGYLITAK